MVEAVRRLFEEEIRLYARFSDPSVAGAEAQRADYHRRIRERNEMREGEYPVLPWTMADLPGTEWRNVHTASLVVIQEIGENSFGKVGPDPGMASMFSIGLWRGDRFCIEHWVRVDRLSVEEQIAWARKRVKVEKRNELRKQDEMKEARAGARSPTYAKYALRGAEESLSEAREELRCLCERLGVMLRTHILNVGAVENEQLYLL